MSAVILSAQMSALNTSALSEAHASAAKPNAVTLTERAGRRIAEIAAGEAPGTALRIAVEGGGCSGFQYKFDLTTERASDDIVLERAGAQVLIDPMSFDYLTGSEIDFVDDLIGAAFKIRNPNATASCGCGTSFSM